VDKNNFWRRIKLLGRIFSKERIVKLIGYYDFELYFGSPKGCKLVKKSPEITFLSIKIHITSIFPPKNEM